MFCEQSSNSEVRKIVLRIGAYSWILSTACMYMYVNKCVHFVRWNILPVLYSTIIYWYIVHWRFLFERIFFFFQNDCDFWETISIRNEDVAEIKLQSMKNIQCLCYRFISVDILRYMYHNTRFRDNCM